VLPLDVLSRGTREAVFLALRLALVASYGRRGIRIPMVLDDVLVNLDAQRAEAAVGVLCEFARDGRQLLFFTCHDHIRAMFERARVDIRVLPGHGTPGVRVAPLELPAVDVTNEPVEEEVFEEEVFEDEALDDEEQEDLVEQEEELDFVELEEDDPEAEEYETEEYAFDEEEEAEEDEGYEVAEEPADLEDEVELDEPIEDYVLADATDRRSYSSAINLDDFEPEEEIEEEPPVAEVEEGEKEEPVAEEEEVEVPLDEVEEDDIVSVEPIDHLFAETEQLHDDEGLWWHESSSWPKREEETAA
jgi:hypothetical protein